MLPPEEQLLGENLLKNPFSSEASPEDSNNVVKTLEFELGFELSDENNYQDGNNPRPSKCLEKLFHPNSEGVSPLGEKLEEKGLPKLEIDEIGGSGSGPTFVDSNMNSSNSNSTASSESEDVSKVLQNLEALKTPEPAEMQESIVTAKFFDDEESKGKGPIKEDLLSQNNQFGLTVNPDLPKIRARQIQNWLEFDKTSEEIEEDEGLKKDAENIDENNNKEEVKNTGSREGSPPQDFELDSLTVTPDENNNAANNNDDGKSTLVTDTHGVQRRVRFLTDAQGNLLISVFLTNGDGEEEEQQQVINLGQEHELPEGMNFSEIESQLAAFVSAQPNEKGDLIDTDKILKELGVEKDEPLEGKLVELENDEEEVVKKPEEKDEEVGRKKQKKILLDLNNGDDDVGSDTETMSTSSCSSMIEVKPKNKKEKELLEVKVDENNNEIPKAQTRNEKNDKKLGKVDLSELSEIVKRKERKGDMMMKIETKATIPKFQPKLVEVELKPVPPPFMPPPMMTMVTNTIPHDSHHLDKNIVSQKINVTVEPRKDFPPIRTDPLASAPLPQLPPVVPMPTKNHTVPQFPSFEDDEQLDSLCIEEEPISAVALTIAKWESFSKMQQQLGESAAGDSNMTNGNNAANNGCCNRVNILTGVKGMGKPMVPIFSMLNNNPNANANGKSPTPGKKLQGPPAVPPKSKNNNGMNKTSGKNGIMHQSNGKVTITVKNGGSGNGGTRSPPPKMAPWATNNTNGINGHGLPHLNKPEVKPEDEECIYEKPNSQAGSLSMTTSLSNPAAILRAYPKPSTRGEIINWFKEGEIHRSGILMTYGRRTNHSSHILAPPPNSSRPMVVSWFYGLITRQQAEEFLLGQPTGTFLVRISTRIWGYTLSYQSQNTTKHFLISAINPAIPATLELGPGLDASAAGKQQMIFPFCPGGKYAFIGTNMTPYTTLTSLIRHHTHAPITKTGGEKLLTPCPGGPKTTGIEFAFKE